MSDLNVQQPRVKDVVQPAAPVVSDTSVNDVIENYLEQLLIEATEPVITSLATTTKVTPSAEVSNEAAVPPMQGLAEASTALSIPSLFNQQWTKNNLPILDWQHHAGVECLLFDVQGLKLAVPLVHLGGVAKLEQDLTPIPGQAAWCLGVYRYQEQSIIVVDSARYLMPERCPKGVSLAPRYIIKLAHQPWALTCQGIVTTHGFIADEIKWRGENSKRPWLAGTIISEMCALLDIHGLLETLQEKYWQAVIPQTNKNSVK